MRKPPRPSERTLPESLTRFLAEPTASIVEEPPRERTTAPSGPRRRNAALRIGLGWALLYNLAGAAILYWLWAIMGLAAP